MDQAQLPAYGCELILDLHACDAAKFTRGDIERFCTGLCELIDMERCDLHFWDDLGALRKSNRLTKNEGNERRTIHPHEYGRHPHARLSEGCVREHLFLQGIRHRFSGKIYSELVLFRRLDGTGRNETLR